MFGRIVHFSVGMMLIITVLASLNRYYQVVPVDLPMLQEVKFPELPEIPQNPAPVAAPQKAPVQQVQAPRLPHVLTVIYPDREVR